MRQQEEQRMGHTLRGREERQSEFQRMRSGTEEM